MHVIVFLLAYKSKNLKCLVKKKIVKSHLITPDAYILVDKNSKRDM